MKRFQVTVTTVRRQVIEVTAATAAEAMFEAGLRSAQTPEEVQDRYLTVRGADGERGGQEG